MSISRFNLQTALAEAEFRGLRINLSPALFLSDRKGDYWRADIYQNRETKSGREGTPTKILTLVSNDGESPADLLRTVALLYEKGETTIGKADQ